MNLRKSYLGIRPRFRRANEHATRGFSLVEVTLALGIASFGMLSTLGLFAVGLTSLRQAVDTTVQAQITDRIVSSIRQTDFSRVTNLTGKTYYYDDQGVAVADASDIGSGKYLYSATLTVTSSTTIPTSEGGAVSPALATVSVQIVNRGNPQVPFNFTTVVASNGS